MRQEAPLDSGLAGFFAFMGELTCHWRSLVYTKAMTTNQEEATMPRHQFDTTEFEFAHGRAPRGRGSWAFFPEGSDTSDVSNAVFAPAGTFTEARRWVRQNCEPGVWRVGS